MSDEIRDIAEEWMGALEDFASADPSMRRCLELAEIAAQTNLPVLILGESGTGKTLLARAIHNSSDRAKGRFVSFNAAALSDTLLDSQLFGHERGAFTGADRRVKGKFELADKGTLFFDEIADLSASGQAKILRAVEYGEFERLGSETIRHANVRLVTATHLPLSEFVESNRFRKDLFYRIKGITITVPPLRERQADLVPLIAAEIDRAVVKEDKEILGLTEEALATLRAYPWPGNLRELSRVIHVAVAICKEGVIGRESLLLDEPPGSVKTAPPTESSPGEIVMPNGDLSLRANERHHIQHVLQLLKGNKRQAAKALGMSRSTLDRKLQQLDLPD